ncbi:MAG: TonB family protein [Methylobacteriaceae bacterium]|nr:TonB family protein [Methylobacteriaceae bacterium]
MAANTNALREGAIGLSERATDVAAFDLTRLLPGRDWQGEKQAPPASSDNGAMRQIATADLFHLPRVTPRFEATRFAIAAGASGVLHAAALLGFVHFGRPALGDIGAEQEIPIEIVIESGARPEAASAPEQAADTPAKAEEAPQVAAASPPEIAPPPPQEAADAAPPPSPGPAQPTPAEPPPLAAASPAPNQQAAIEATPEVRPNSTPTPRPPTRIERDEQEPVDKAVQRELQRRAERRAIERARAEQHMRQAREEAERRAAEREQRRKAARLSAARAQAERRAERAEARRMAAVERGGAGSRPAAASGAHVSRATDFDAASYRALVARAVRAAVGSRCSLGAGSRVVIALSIGRSGAVSGASISSPSGNSAFDAASLAAVRRAGPFPPLQGRSGVSVPVGVACR